MPFTVTHAIAVLPFAFIFSRLLLSGLVIGCMIPDLPLFIAYGQFKHSAYLITHSFAGLFYACLPLGLIAYFLYHLYIKSAAYYLLSPKLQAKLAVLKIPLTKLNTGPSIRLLFSIVIGACTHIVWDAFTHRIGWGLEIFPSLRNIVTIAGIDYPAYRLFQYGSSLIGLPVLGLILYYSLAKSKPKTVSSHLKPAFKIIGLILLVTVPIFASLLNISLSNSPLKITVLFILVTTSISSILLVLLICGVIIRHWENRLINKIS